MDPRRLRHIYQDLENAVLPEDLFGPPEDSQEQTLAKIKRIYIDRAKAIHPDHHMQDQELREMADDATGLLNQLHDRARRRVAKGFYGTRRPLSKDDAERFTIRTRNREYAIRETVARGDFAVIYGGSVVGAEADDSTAEVVVKVAEDPADNDLLGNEIRILGLFATKTGVQKKHLPVLLDRFKTKEGASGIIQKRIAGFDLHSVREVHKKGVAQEHIIWIFRRVLSVLGFAHSHGVIHGNVEPSHIMLRPKDHNVYLIDWTTAVYKPAQTGQNFGILNDTYSAPEVAEKKPPLPAADLYSAAKCMIHALGGDPVSNEIPDKVDERIRRFLLFFLRESPIQRPRDAWEMYHKLDQLREEVFGPHKFIEFKM